MTVPAIPYHNGYITIEVGPTDTSVRWSVDEGAFLTAVIPNAEPSWRGRVLEAIRDSESAIDAEAEAATLQSEREAEAIQIVAVRT